MPARRIAVVDDDPAVRQALRFMLEVDGFLVTTFPDATAFLSSLAGRPLPDCLIVDYAMPGLTGLELAALLRFRGLFIPTIMICGKPVNGLAARAGAVGIDRIVEKPLGEDSLGDALRDVLVAGLAGGGTGPT